jgi:hypothetical protein
MLTPGTGIDIDMGKNCVEAMLFAYGREGGVFTLHHTSSEPSIIGPP